MGDVFVQNRVLYLSVHLDEQEAGREFGATKKKKGPACTGQEAGNRWILFPKSHTVTLSSKTQSSTRTGLYMGKRFCKNFSEHFPCLPGQQESCSTTVQLSETILQNILPK